MLCLLEGDAVLPLVQPEDLLAYGMIPEFVGRVPVLTTLDALSEDDLLRVLTEPRDALIKQSQRLFAMDGVEAEFTDAALRKIVALTVRKGTGARGPGPLWPARPASFHYPFSSRFSFHGCTTIWLINQSVQYFIPIFIFLF